MLRSADVRAWHISAAVYLMSSAHNASAALWHSQVSGQHRHLWLIAILIQHADIPQNPVRLPMYFIFHQQSSIPLSCVMMNAPRCAHLLLPSFTLYTRLTALLAPCRSISSCMLTGTLPDSWSTLQELTVLYDHRPPCYFTQEPSVRIRASCPWLPLLYGRDLTEGARVAWYQAPGQQRAHGQHPRVVGQHARHYSDVSTGPNPQTHTAGCCPAGMD